jgi:hypothetical protein
MKTILLFIALSLLAAPTSLFRAVDAGETIHYQYADGSFTWHSCSAKVSLSGAYTVFRAWCWGEGEAAEYSFTGQRVVAETGRVPRVAWLKSGTLTVESSVKREIYAVWLPVVMGK